MFTGLVEELGSVNSADKHPWGLRLSVKRPDSFTDVKTGDSIAVNGACLTVSSLGDGLMVFDAVAESLKRSTLDKIRSGDRVNLERALKVGARLGGHFVTGHIDCKGNIKSLKKSADNTKFEISLPKGYRRFITPKGSITVDGVSLTVGECFSDTFSVYIIPHTLKNTTLGLKRTHRPVNVEFDILAKYVLESKNEEKNTKVNMGFLKTHGFA